MKDIVEYNNNIFSYKGKIARLSYFIQNSLIMIIAFKYMYYPYLYQTILDLTHNPAMSQIMAVYKQLPQFNSWMEELKAGANPPLSSIIIKYLFFIPLRVIDIKRMRDIVNRNLTMVETVMIAFFFSLPFVDLLATCFLVVIPSNKHAKNSALTREVKAQDMKEAQVERLLQQNQKLFEEGKISRADYIKTRDKYKKS